MGGCKYIFLFEAVTMPALLPLDLDNNFLAVVAAYYSVRTAIPALLRLICPPLYPIWGLPIGPLLHRLWDSCQPLLSAVTGSDQSLQSYISG
jgi:hypothetical protein